MKLELDFFTFENFLFFSLRLSKKNFKENFKLKVCLLFKKVCEN